MSSMDRNDNVQSHPKFKAKFIRDLKALFESRQYETYIERFKQFKKLNTPDDILVNYYYEALMQSNLYYYVIDYALERLHNGTGEYEDNMSFLLKAMLEEGRYGEVLDFTEHLMNETIPHRFRMFIQDIRHEAQSQIDALKDNRRTQIEDDDEEEPVNKEVYLKYTDDEKLAFIARITNLKQTVHRQTLRDVIDDVEDNTVKTAMLLYLKAIGDDEAIDVTKHGDVSSVIPSNLPQLEDTQLGGIVLSEVMMELEGNAPDIMELAQSLIISIMMEIYPVEPPFDDETLVVGFLKYIHNIVNIPYEDIGESRVTAWIERHFES